MARILEVSEGYDSPTEEDNDVFDKDIALRLNEKAPLVSLLYYHASFLKINHLLLSTFRVGRLTISISFHRQRKIGLQLQLFVKNLERRRKGKLQISPWICVKYRHYDLCTMVIQRCTERRNTTKSTGAPTTKENSFSALVIGLLAEEIQLERGNGAVSVHVA